MEEVGHSGVKRRNFWHFCTSNMIKSTNNGKKTGKNMSQYAKTGKFWGFSFCYNKTSMGGRQKLEFKEYQTERVL